MRSQLNILLQIYLENSLHNSINVFNEYFATCICFPVVYKYVPITIRIVSCTSDIHWSNRVIIKHLYMFTHVFLMNIHLCYSWAYQVVPSFLFSKVRNQNWSSRLWVTVLSPFAVIFPLSKIKIHPPDSGPAFWTYGSRF